MQLSIELPEDVRQALTSRWADLPRRTLEAIAIDGYAARALTEGQVRRMLGFETRMEVHEFLKSRGVYLDYTEEDLDEDLAAHRRLGILPAG